MTTIRLGISTCPNDTFAFDALIERRVDWRGLRFEIRLMDIQHLNDGLFRGEFDVAKASFHAAIRLADQCVVLPSGSALGFGVGPLLLASEPGRVPQRDPGQRTLCPGSMTTAALLFELFYSGRTTVEHVLFSDIMSRLKNRNADFGVCIHEGRFTWQGEGLSLVEDLGARWERETDCPLPLGGILATRTLSDETIATVQTVIRDSIETARGNPMAAMPTMRRYAQEFDDDVLMKHVDLYVNDWTVDLGTTGQSALDRLSAMAVKCGMISSGSRLRVFGQH